LGSVANEMVMARVTFISLLFWEEVGRNMHVCCGVRGGLRQFQ